jgi:hypothetical protein
MGRLDQRVVETGPNGRACSPLIHDYNRRYGSGVTPFFIRSRKPNMQTHEINLNKKHICGITKKIGFYR